MERCALAVVRAEGSIKFYGAVIIMSQRKREQFDGPRDTNQGTEDWNKRSEDPEEIGEGILLGSLEHLGE
jgi:hypothetical protein